MPVKDYIEPHTHTLGPAISREVVLSSEDVFVVQHVEWYKPPIYACEMLATVYKVAEKIPQKIKVLSEEGGSS